MRRWLEDYGPFGAVLLVILIGILAGVLCTQPERVRDTQEQELRILKAQMDITKAKAEIENAKARAVRCAKARKDTLFCIKNHGYPFYTAMESCDKIACLENNCPSTKED